MYWLRTLSIGGAKQEQALTVFTGFYLVADLSLLSSRYGRCLWSRRLDCRCPHSALFLRTTTCADSQVFCCIWLLHHVSRPHSRLCHRSAVKYMTCVQRVSRATTCGIRSFRSEAQQRCCDWGGHDYSARSQLRISIAQHSRALAGREEERETEKAREG